MLDLPEVLLRHGLLDNGVGEMDLDGLGVCESCLKGIAQGHEFVDFGDDAVLFVFGCNRDRHASEPR